jgi:hypothetical protein
MHLNPSETFVDVVQLVLNRDWRKFRFIPLDHVREWWLIKRPFDTSFCPSTRFLPRRVEAECLGIRLDDEIERPAFTHAEALRQFAHKGGSMPFQHRNGFIIHNMRTEHVAFCSLHHNSSMFVVFHNFRMNWLLIST